MDTSNKIYFLSTGRSGTSFLYKYFSSFYPEFKITHQTKWSRIINVLGNMSLSLHLKSNFNLSFFKFFKNETVPINTLDPLLSLSIYTFIKKEKIKNSKIVHLVRDPRDFVTSFMNWKNQSLSKKILHYFIPFWQAPPLGKGINIFRWIFMSKFEKYCWVWYYKNSLFKELLNKTDYKLFKFEDLTISSKKSEHIKTLTNFLELEEKTSNYQEIASKAVNKSAIKKFPSYEHWSQKQKDTLQGICGDLMLEFGYK